MWDCLWQDVLRHVWGFADQSFVLLVFSSGWQPNEKVSINDDYMYLSTNVHMYLCIYTYYINYTVFATLDMFCSLVCIPHIFIIWHCLYVRIWYYYGLPLEQNWCNLYLNSWWLLCCHPWSCRGCRYLWHILNYRLGRRVFHQWGQITSNLVCQAF